jgi:HSP20 family protein
MAGLVPFNRRGRDLMNTGFEDFYNLLDDFFTPRSMERGTFKLDVQDNEKEYIIEAELPGISKEEINLDLSEGRLTIGVKQTESSEDSRKNYVHRERRVTSMNRSVYLADAQPDGITAKLNNGMLSIVVQKQEKQMKSRKIDIE